MAWGLSNSTTLTQAYLNQYVGSRIANVAAAMQDMNDIYVNWYGKNGIAGITGVGQGQLGFSASDGNVIAAVFTEWGNYLYNTMNGNARVTAATVQVGTGSGFNFMFNAGQGMGLAAHG